MWAQNATKTSTLARSCLQFAVPPPKENTFVYTDKFWLTNPVSFVIGPSMRGFPDPEQLGEFFWFCTSAAPACLFWVDFSRNPKHPIKAFQGRNAGPNESGEPPENAVKLRMAHGLEQKYLFGRLYSGSGLACRRRLWARWHKFAELICSVYSFHFVSLRRQQDFSATPGQSLPH